MKDTNTSGVKLYTQVKRNMRVGRIGRAIFTRVIWSRKNEIFRVISFSYIRVGEKFILHALDYYVIHNINVLG